MHIAISKMFWMHMREESLSISTLAGCASRRGSCSCTCVCSLPFLHDLYICPALKVCSVPPNDRDHLRSRSTWAIWSHSSSLSGYRTLLMCPLSFRSQTMKRLSSGESLHPFKQPCAIQTILHMMVINCIWVLQGPGVGGGIQIRKGKHQGHHCLRL